MVIQSGLITMAIDIRSAEETDQAAIRKIVRGAGLYPFELDWQHFYIAAANKSIAGVGQIKSHRDGSMELASIAVVAEFRRQGVATALIQNLISTAEGDLYLLCQDDLEGFYQGFGFITAGREDLPSPIARRQRLGNFILSIAALFSRRPVRILAMRRVVTKSVPETSKPGASPACI